ncbi:glucodextranase DOMON-like domain-containing protein [Palaeococcus ferrophilus]|uniref:glucodextranase DOMON-like domain-containing protein n=1 Tax=Palaeococcus ferrophilus TaxID=83868 RepID=UPI00064EC3B1
MRKLGAVLAALMLLGVFGFVFASATTVAVDLAHGENDKYLAQDVLDFDTNETLAHGIIPTIDFVDWAYFGDPTQADVLGITNLGEKITADALNGVDVLIIGQPTSPFDPEEIMAIVDWFNQGGKVLWIAGDSDYGSGPQVIDYVDTLLEQLGVKLRLDQASVESPTLNAGAGYRVIGIVNPDPNTPNADVITQGFKHEGHVLYHGPGVVAWVDDDGNWQPLIDGNVPENVYRIVKTAEDGTIVENTDPAANAYLAGDTGVFTLLAAEKMGDSWLIVSGESPYGDYEPTWSAKYHGVELDGPTFVTNMIKWITGLTAAPAPAGEEVVDIKDPEGDDHGPGTYTYPTNAVFNGEGLFDLVDFKIKDAGDNYILEFYFKNLGGNPWNGQNGFSLQIIEAYFDFKDGGSTDAIKMDENAPTPGSNVAIDPDHPWDVALRIHGWGNTLVLPDGTTKDVKVSADLDKNVIMVEVPKDYLEVKPGLYGAILVGSQDGFGVDTWRAVAVDAEEWKLGGAEADAVINGVAPRVLDLLVPAGFKPTQEEQLKSYDAANAKPAVVKMIPIIKPKVTTVTQTVTQTETVTTKVQKTVTATETTTTTTSGTCGPAAIGLFALLPLLALRKKRE